MTREEFIQKWGSCKKEGGAILVNAPMEPFPEISTDLDSLSLPPAEGAEEILDKHSRYHPVTKLVYTEDVLVAMQDFATLHAQRIADKIVSERCKKCKYRGLPDSINEALNSGDGVYRP